MDQSTPANDAQRLAQLEAILDNAVDAIITIDERGIVHSVNEATERLFGYTAEEVLGRNVKLLMPSPYQEEHDGYLQQYIATGIRKIIGIGREVVGRRKNGTVFPMHLAVSEVTVDDTRRFAGIVRDISDLKETQRQLTELNEQLEERVRERTHELREAQAELVKKEKLATLGQVSGGIAHEIRNPLNAIKSSAYFLLNARNPSEEKIKEHLERIDRQVTGIDNVVTALSDVARLPQPRLAPTEVAELLRSVVSSVALSDRIEIKWDLPEAIPLVNADSNQIPIVFRNLIRNARDAMPEGGTITVGVESADGEVCVFVRDTGVGIKPEDIDRIQEPMYSTKARGMGLGLAICIAIVRKNAGRIEIESEPGIGSTFAVTLKAAPADPTESHDAGQ